ncbi:MAG: AIR synthase family protein [Eubacteriaceae bacterium]|jgi:hydrogenase expression/formation protein HypE|nr:AIR synthase family protein [Eubacteriaceae bacterium]
MLKVGKLDSDLLKEIVFDKITYKRPEVITRPGIGEDCAVVDFGDYECVMSTDPITAAISDIGRLCIHISCNDIASNGIQPVGILLAVLLPVGTTEEQIAEMMRQAGEASAELGVEIIGGHTEITDAVKQPVITSTAIGRGPKGGSQSADDIVPGDFLLITKKAGIEGTGVIARDKADELAKFMTAEEVEKAQDLLKLVSVVKEGVIAGGIGTHGMHDVTEGGVLGAVWEMCSIAGVGCEIDRESIPAEAVTLKMCGHYGIDPLRLISSGCMMIAAAADKKDEMTAAIEAAGIDVCCIGRIMPAEYGLRISGGGRSAEITPPEPDEIYKVVG